MLLILVHELMEAQGIEQGHDESDEIYDDEIEYLNQMEAQVHEYDDEVVEVMMDDDDRRATTIS